MKEKSEEKLKFNFEKEAKRFLKAEEIEFFDAFVEKINDEELTLPINAKDTETKVFQLFFISKWISSNFGENDSDKILSLMKDLNYLLKSTRTIRKFYERLNVTKITENNEENVEKKDQINGDEDELDELSNIEISSKEVEEWWGEASFSTKSKKMNKIDEEDEFDKILSGKSASKKKMSKNEEAIEKYLTGNLDYDKLGYDLDVVFDKFDRKKGEKSETKGDQKIDLEIDDWDILANKKDDNESDEEDGSGVDEDDDDDDIQLDKLLEMDENDLAISLSKSSNKKEKKINNGDNIEKKEVKKSTEKVSKQIEEEEEEEEGVEYEYEYEYVEVEEDEEEEEEEEEEEVEKKNKVEKEEEEEEEEEFEYEEVEVEVEVDEDGNIIGEEDGEEVEYVEEVEEKKSTSKKTGDKKSKFSFDFDLDDDDKDNAILSHNNKIDMKIGSDDDINLDDFDIDDVDADDVDATELEEKAKATDGWNSFLIGL